MNSLASDIRQMLSKRMEQATLTEILDLARALGANDDHARINVRPRFTKVDASGRHVSDSATDWVAIYDAETQLTWTSHPLSCGELPWKESLKAASDLRLFGKSDWRAPTLKEHLSILDYSRFNPALDTAYFSKDTNWCWTSTPDAENPSDFAWLVDLHSGDVSRSAQTGHGRVRAVRAGQALNLGL